jgi:hypothetical protein
LPNFFVCKCGVGHFVCEEKIDETLSLTFAKRMHAVGIFPNRIENLSVSQCLIAIGDGSFPQSNLMSFIGIFINRI